MKVFYVKENDMCVFFQEIFTQFFSNANAALK